MKDYIYPGAECVLRNGLQYHHYEEYNGRLFGRYKTKVGYWLPIQHTLNGYALGKFSPDCNIIGPWQPCREQVLKACEGLRPVGILVVSPCPPSPQNNGKRR